MAQHTILTEPNLQERLIDFLKAFNDEKAELTPDTVHNQVLSTTDGVGKVASSKYQYESAVKYSIARGLIKEGAKKKDAEKFVSKLKLLPNWMNASVRDFVSDLVSKLPILLLFLLISYGASAQLEFNAGVGRTVLGKSGMTIGLHYLRSIDSTKRDLLRANSNSYFQLSPEFEIQDGTEDAFSSIQAKLTGSIFTFKTNEVAGIPGIDFSKFYSVYPISAGIETNGNFSVLNGIFEAGYIPVYWTETQSSPEWLKRTRLGFFLQAGYKFKRDTTGLAGGEKDESSEEAKRNILRLKGAFQAFILKPVTIYGFRVGLVGGADGWYDAANGAAYYKLEGDVRFFLSGDNYISMLYAKGSGAPLFNSGSQFGIGLNVTF